MQDINLVHFGMKGEKNEFIVATIVVFGSLVVLNAVSRSGSMDITYPMLRGVISLVKFALLFLFDVAFLG